MLHTMSAAQARQPSIEFYQIYMNHLDWEQLRLFRDEHNPQAAADMEPVSFLGLQVGVTKMIPPGTHMIVTAVDHQPSHL